MQARFGDHLGIGCAGENILIEAELVISLDQVARGVAIETRKGARRALECRCCHALQFIWQICLARLQRASG